MAYSLYFISKTRQCNSIDDIDILSELNELETLESVIDKSYKLYGKWLVILSEDDKGNYTIENLDIFNCIEYLKSKKLHKLNKLRCKSYERDTF